MGTPTIKQMNYIRDLMKKSNFSTDAIDERLEIIDTFDKASEYISRLQGALESPEKSRGRKVSIWTRLDPLLKRLGYEPNGIDMNRIVYELSGHAPLSSVPAEDRPQVVDKLAEELEKRIEGLIHLNDDEALDYLCRQAMSIGIDPVVMMSALCEDHEYENIRDITPAHIHRMREILLSPKEAEVYKMALEGNIKSIFRMVDEMCGKMDMDTRIKPRPRLRQEG